MDLDLRLVRYFTVVAEYQHFGRAAEALHLAQPSLSRQIQRLEDQLGVRLLDRTPQGTHLSAAGRVFLPQAKELLGSVHRAATQARAAGEHGAVTIGYTPNIPITAVVRQLRYQHPDADVSIRHLRWDEPRAALHDHRIDVALARPPFPTDQVDVTVLYEEARVLMVPTSHRLAGKASITLDDFADEPLPVLADPAYNAFWRIDPRPDGRPAPPGPLVDNYDDKLEYIAGDAAVCIAPAAVQASTLRPDVTTVPIEGIAPCQVVLVTRAGESSPMVGAFCDVARTHLGPQPRA